ncbi:MAG: DUF2961 domain-containing protein, partial [Pirellulaceae bacterium]|nr:DUF2961 domain-containing protein [Pirellulaceae bacterium]
DVGQMSSCYRWHIGDPIVFNKSLRVAIETMGWLNIDENPENKSRFYGQRQDDVSSVAFWYQIGPTKKFAEPTTADDRKLPCIDPVIAWGEDHKDAKHHGRGRVRMVGSACYYDTDRVLEFTPKSRGDAWVELTLDVKKKEPLRLILFLERSPESGIYQATLDGVKVGRPIDLYGAKREIDDYQLMDFWPEPGKYTLRLECVGRNHLSSGDQLRINSARLRERRPRVKEIGFLKDHDWRSNPILIDKNAKPLK